MIYTLPALSTFSVGENCLNISESISHAICNGLNLTHLYLNGLRTASVCRNNQLFFKVPLYIPYRYVPTTYYLEQYASMPIPQCILSLPKLNTLFISGVALTGNIEFIDSTFPLSENLTNLVLAHNYFSGTIPDAIQHRTSWEMLDLGFNRFTGTLSPGMNLSLENANLNLINNRSVKVKKK
jgi:hypothetical protein